MARVSQTDMFYVTGKMKGEMFRGTGKEKGGKGERARERTNIRTRETTRKVMCLGQTKAIILS